MDNKTIKFSEIITSETVMGVNCNCYQQAVKLKKALGNNKLSTWRTHVGHYYFNNEKTVYLNNGEVVSIEECQRQGIHYYPMLEIDFEKYLSSEDQKTIEQIEERHQKNKEKEKAKAAQAEKEKLKNAEFRDRINAACRERITKSGRGKSL